MNLIESIEMKTKKRTRSRAFLERQSEDTPLQTNKNMEKKPKKKYIYIKSEEAVANEYIKNGRSDVALGGMAYYLCTTIRFVYGQPSILLFPPFFPIFYFLFYFLF